MSKGEDLRASAGSGLLWGVGFTLVRDVIQFVAMLFMVRLLSPEAYGQAALAQTIIAFLAVMSFKTLAPFALQSRNPQQFDWDTHFSAGLILNLLAFAVTNLLALGVLLLGDAQAVMTASVVAVMSLTFLIEIASTYYTTWLQAFHRWRRMRLLLATGAVLAASGGVLFAWLGAGVFALAITNLLAFLPMVIDLLLFSEHRPRMSLKRLSQYGAGIKWGLNRAASGGLSGGVGLVEQTFLTGFFGFGSLGTYTRAIGLGQLTSGRVGPIVMQTLYPVLTRADVNSERFRRFSATLLQGILWVSIPAATFLAIDAKTFVDLLYGAKWDSVVPLLPYASALLALRGVITALYYTMMANRQQTACIIVDFFTAGGSIAIVFVAMPNGVEPYLIGLIVQSIAIILVLTVLALRGGAIDGVPFLRNALSCLLAAAVAVAIVSVIPHPHYPNSSTWLLVGSLFLRAVAFGLIYVAVLRLTARRSFLAILDALPLQARLRRTINFFVAIPAPKS